MPSPTNFFLGMNAEPEIEIPPLSKSLLEALEQSFPSQDFTTDKDLRDLDFHYGQRSVVNFLWHHYRMQNETILTKD